MASRSLRVLLIEDDPVAAEIFHGILEAELGAVFDLRVAESLAQAKRILQREPPDIVVLDLVLPDCRGLEGLRKLRADPQAPPIVVLTSLDDEDLAIEALEQGAQDYLVKGELEPRFVGRAIRYAIERHRLTGELRAGALRDELTGLLNRRGFLDLAPAQLGVAARLGRGAALIYADVDGLVRINDHQGRPAGDEVLRRVGRVLATTFRTSDLLARYGGDEFAVLTLHEAASGIATVLERLRRNLAASDGRPALSVSLGCGWTADPGAARVEDLVTAADRNRVA